MKLITLWKFGRPHTILGSVIGIFTLIFIVCEHQETIPIGYLTIALIIGITCNVFIVGVNQIADVEIDKINKPFLPIPSGALSIPHAKIVVFASLFISLVLALSLSPYLFLIIALATATGWAYSMPPFYLKKHHISAALAITFVRGILLNAGGFLVFNYLINDSLNMPDNIKILTLFVVAFSVAISWFKDLSDMKGDAQYHIKTFAIAYTPIGVLVLGNLLVGFAYLFTIYMKWAEFLNAEIPTVENSILLIGHIFLFVLFVANAVAIRLSHHQSIVSFYKRFWWLFFLEYLLYLIAYAVN